MNHQPDATVFQFIILTVVCSSTCFGRFPAHHQVLNDCGGSLWFYLRIVVTVVLVFVVGPAGWPAGPTTNNS
jgi:EamA domain-containing membrane protein RarD